MSGTLRRSRRLGLVIALAILIAALGSALTWLAANPAIAGTLCPPCFGLAHLDGRIWVEPSLGAGERERLINSLAEARAAVSSVFGNLATDPVLLVCASEKCDRRLGGRGTRAVAFGWHIVRVSPRGRNVVVLAHELSHTEFHWRTGAWALVSGRYPAWFDEGLAVLISRDPRFLEVGGVGAPRCKGNWDESEMAALPRSVWQWMREAGETRDLYSRAACIVARWYAAAGRDGLMELIEELRGGADFDAAFARDRGRRLPRPPQG